MYVTQLRAFTRPQHPFQLSLYLSTGCPLRTLCGQKYREEEEKTRKGGKRKHEKEKKMPAKTITTN